MDSYILVNAREISLIDSNVCFFEKCVTSILDLHVLFFYSALAMLQKSAKTVFYGELQEGKRSQGSQNETLQRHL